MMVERYPILEEEVGGSIPGCEISSQLDKELARWSTASYALVLACRHSISTKKKPPDDLSYFNMSEDPHE